MKNAVVVMSLIVAGSFAAVASANKPAGAQCWSTPNKVSVGDSYTVSASGLPNGGPLNLIVVRPDGQTLTSPVTSTDGSYLLQPSSGGVFLASQTGSYTFSFVGKVNWPSGDANKVYATCSMQVS
jgi:hypothetical protein